MSVGLRFDRSVAKCRTNVEQRVISKTFPLLLAREQRRKLGGRERKRGARRGKRGRFLFCKFESALKKEEEKEDDRGKKKKRNIIIKVSIDAHRISLLFVLAFLLMFELS